MDQSKSRLITLILVIIVGALTLGPATMLIIGSFSEGFGAFGTLTFEKYARVYSDPRLYGALRNTLIFTFGSAILATTLAFGLAYLNHRTDVPFRGLLHLIPTIPMMIPHLAYGAAWAILLNPSNGIVNVFLRDVLGLGIINIYSLPGMVFIEGLLELPIAYLVIAPAMASFDATMEEASWICGVSPRKTMRKITLKMLLPAILAALTLATVRSLSAFAIPSVLGFPNRIDVLTTFVYRLVSTGLFPDYGRAAAVGVNVLVSAVILVFVYRHYTATAERFVTIGGKGHKIHRMKLGKMRLPMGILALSLGILLIIVPVIVLAYISVVPYIMPPGPKAFSMLTLANWKAVLSEKITLVAFRNSTFLALVGATVGILLSTVVSYVIVRIRNAGSTVLETLAFASFGFPGLIIGIGFMWALVRTSLYATIWALLVGYVATYLPFGIRPLTSTFIQIDTDLESASLVCGAGLFRTFRRVIAPLALPGIISGWTMMAIMFVQELNLSVILARPGTEVLSVLTHRAVNDAFWGRVATLGVIMIALSAVLLGLTRIFTRKFAS
ncbi:MAG: iron ABC transporter permease [Firmicutes bacterium]|nr:iron ABC transporter permease [Bacillota bacterium]